MFKLEEITNKSQYDQLITDVYYLLSTSTPPASHKSENLENVV